MFEGTIFRVGAAVLLAWGLSAMPASAAEDCLSCHDFIELKPTHGEAGSGGIPMDRHGCADCHGNSASHSKAPTNVAPGVSFGPRWTNTPAAQDELCLNCHQEDAAQDWKNALHMVNDVTCITCHDIHNDEDAVTAHNSQGEVCTICHKEQKPGIHGLAGSEGKDPTCTQCHNPHDSGDARVAALDNRSEGCRSCHDLVEMSLSRTASEKALSYHKVMAQKDRTCMDCHQGVAHHSTENIPPMVPEASNTGTITLFPAGLSDSEWLLSSHPGSQPLRQGRGCQQCHRGEEERMAQALDAGLEPALRDIQISFAQEGDNLTLQLRWNGPADEADIAILWGSEANDGLSRGGCFAACHSDMSGMRRDRDGNIGKYLVDSRSQQRAIGRPAITRGQEELDQLVAQGNFGEMWRIVLNGGTQPTVETALLLDGLQWRDRSPLTGSASYADGRWQVTLSRPLSAGAGYQPLDTAGSLTFGVALHGADNPDGRHWISLPRRFSLSQRDSDFKAQ